MVAMKVSHEDSVDTSPVQVGVQQAILRALATVE